MISRQKRFSIYFIIAILLFVTYLFRETDQEISLPKLGTIPEFEFTDSEENLISRTSLSPLVLSQRLPCFLRQSITIPNGAILMAQLP